MKANTTHSGTTSEVCFAFPRGEYALARVPTWQRESRLHVRQNIDRILPHGIERNVEVDEPPA